MSDKEALSPVTGLASSLHAAQEKPSPGQQHTFFAVARTAMCKHWDTSYSVGRLIEVYPCGHMTYFDSRRSMANATPCQPSSSRVKDWFIVSRNRSRRQAGCLFCSHQAQ